MSLTEFNFGEQMLKKIIIIGIVTGVLAGLASCGASNPPMISDGHIKSPAPSMGEIPEPVIQSPVLPKPTFRPNLETYTVIVNQVPLRELL